MQHGDVTTSIKYNVERDERYLILIGLGCYLLANARDAGGVTGVFD